MAKLHQASTKRPDFETIHHVVGLDEIIAYFAKGFKVKKGRAIFGTEYYVDVAKGKVVFLLTTTPDDTP